MDRPNSADHAGDPEGALRVPEPAARSGGAIRSAEAEPDGSAPVDEGEPEDEEGAEVDLGLIPDGYEPF